MLEKTLECPLHCKEIQPVHSEGDQPWISLEGMMLKLKLQYFGHLMRRVDSLEKTLESPLDCKEVQPVKEISPGCSLEGLMLKLKL